MLRRSVETLWPAMSVLPYSIPCCAAARSRTASRWAGFSKIGSRRCAGASASCATFAAKIVEDCLKAGLLINATAHKVLRFIPPLTIGKKDIEQGLAILEKVLARQ